MLCFIVEQMQLIFYMMKILLQMCFCALELNGTMKTCLMLFDFCVFLLNAFSLDISVRIIKTFSML